MIEIKYRCSNGNEYNLIGDRMRVTNGNFHKYSWNKNVVESANGDILKGFSKEAITYSITINFRGRLEERKKLLDDLTNDFEYDITTKKPGKIIYGEYYIECYVIESETNISEIKNNWSQKVLKIYCPKAYWISEQHITIPAISKIQTMAVNNTKKYPYTYPYRYADVYKNTKVNIDHYAESDFRMIAYGPTANVNVSINGHKYHVDYPIESGEHMVIDSRDYLPPNERIYLVKSNGEKINVFNYRDPEHSVFQKIAPGYATIYYNQSYGIDLTIFKERSEPKWR